MTTTSTALLLQAGVELNELLDRLNLAGSIPTWTVAVTSVVGGVVLAVAWRVTAAMRRINPAATVLHEEPGTLAHPAGSTGSVGARLLIAVAITAAASVAGLGGVRSFEAVSDRFGSALVPLTADGMIIACTALRLAALTRGWRLPGSLITTYGFIGGTVWLNVAAADGWTEAVAHALAPVSYAVLVEFLAHMLRLHLRLAQPSRPRVTALTWVTSPIVTTRVWLHMARSGEPDPAVARALVQQLIRMSSRLHAVCPSRRAGGLWSLDRARAARTAALQTVRDGVLSASELAALLPVDGRRLDPGALLALVDRAALTPTSARTAAPPGASTSAPTGPVTSAPHNAFNGAANGAANDATNSAVVGPSVSVPGAVHTASPESPESPVTGDGSHTTGRGDRTDRTDDELVAELHRYAAVHHDGQPLTQRHVMRVLGVGTPKAKRLTAMAWPSPDDDQSTPAATGPDAAAPPGPFLAAEPADIGNSR